MNLLGKKWYFGKVVAWERWSYMDVRLYLGKRKYGDKGYLGKRYIYILLDGLVCNIVGYFYSSLVF